MNEERLMRQLITWLTLLTLLFLPLAGQGMAMPHAQHEVAPGAEHVSSQHESAMVQETAHKQQSHSDPHCDQRPEPGAVSQSEPAGPDTATAMAHALATGDCCDDGLCDPLQCEQNCGHCVSSGSGSCALSDSPQPGAPGEAASQWPAVPAYHSLINTLPTPPPNTLLPA